MGHVCSKVTSPLLGGSFHDGRKWLITMVIVSGLWDPFLKWPLFWLRNVGGGVTNYLQVLG